MDAGGTESSSSWSFHDDGPDEVRTRKAVSMTFGHLLVTETLFF